jgi:predicted DNA-binding protein
MAIAKDKIRVPITMPKTLKVALDRLAEQDNRTVGNYVVTILQRHVDEANEKES